MKRDSDQEASGGGEILTWIVDVPLLTNPIVLRALVPILAIAYLFVVGIFGIVLASADHLERLPAFMGLMAIGFAFLALLALLVILVFFRNRMRVRYVLDDAGVTSVVVDRRAEIAGSLAVFAGTASANATLARSGLVAAGSQREHTKWNRIREARFRPERNFVSLVAAGSWPVGAIHCTPESYPVVEKRIHQILSSRNHAAAAG